MKQIVINLFGGPGAGKCFAPGTRLVMADGTLKNVENIEAGEYVLGVDSNPKKVLNTHSGIDQMYIVKQNRAMNYVVNSQHDLCLQRTKGSFGSKKGKPNKRYPNRPDELVISIQDYLTTSNKFQRSFKGYKVRSEFQEQPVFIDPYFLGLWLGDGDSAGTAITSMDEEILVFVEEHAEANGLRTTTYEKKDNQAVTVRSVRADNSTVPNIIKQSLKYYGIFKNKQIPQQYLVNSSEVRLQLLAGLIDTDGEMDHNCFYLTLKSEKLIRDAYRLANSLGFKTSLKPITKKCHNNGVVGQYYRLSISGELDQVPTRLLRKQTNCIKRCNPYQTGIKIEKGDVGLYYGIEVEDHLMLLEDNTVVHNSTQAAKIFARLKEQNINAELITEYAKDLTWQESFKVLSNQHYVFAKQHHRMWRVNDKVQVIITDSPLLLSLIYGDTKNPFFVDYVKYEFEKYENVNIFLQRPNTFQQEGRTQTLEEAKGLDAMVRQMMAENGYRFMMDITVHQNLAEIIADYVKNMIWVNEKAA